MDAYYASIPSQENKIAIVSGANIGLGKEIATQLYRKNANVILACRDVSKAEIAKQDILKLSAPSKGTIEVMKLDIGDFDSIRSFSNEYKNKYQKLDLLMNNAGVMALPTKETTKNGFEMQFGVNHLGGFLLTSLLLPVLMKTEGSRVVNHSSSANYYGSFEWDNLNAEKSYDKWKQYMMSKLCNVAFSNELSKRLTQSSHAYPIVTSAHPGLVYGQLQQNAHSGSFVDGILDRFLYLLSQDVHHGALPALHALTAPDAKTGRFYGPNGINNGVLGGFPKELQPNKLANDESSLKKLWDKSVELTQSTWDF